MATEKCHICNKEIISEEVVVWHHDRDKKPTCHQCHTKLDTEIKIFYCSDCHNWLSFTEIGLVGCSRDRCNQCYKTEVTN
jgi:hypothetical protein